MKTIVALALQRLGIFRPVFDIYETARRFSWQEFRRRQRYIKRLDAGEWPLPPMVLTTSVAGCPDPIWFLESGKAGAHCIRDVLARFGTDLDRFNRILDFGCGCGRVIRHLPYLTRATIFGSDVNGRAVRWCQENLGFGRFVRNGLEPPMPFESNAFDLVYSFSVFTHLPEALQHVWASEISRVLRPGGLFVASLNGVESRKDMTVSEVASFDAGHLVVRASEVPGSNRCAAYHPFRYVAGHLFSDWLLVEHLPAGALGNPPQDLYLFRHSSSSESPSMPRGASDP